MATSPCQSGTYLKLRPHSPNFFSGQMRKLPDKIKLRGQVCKVLGDIRVDGQWFLIVEKRERSGRTRLRVARRKGRHYREFSIHQFEDNVPNREKAELMLGAGKTSLPTPSVLSYERRDGVLNVVTEYVTGQPLGSYFTECIEGRRPAIESYDAARLHTKLVQQVFTLNSRGIIHGDISADNLILSPGSTRLVLIDFGSAFRFSKTTSRDTGDGAHWRYQSPSVNRGSDPNHNSEMFSCSMVFYELLTLKTAFDGLGGSYVREIDDRKASEVLNKELDQVQKKLVPQFAANDLRALLSRTLDPLSKQPFSTQGQWKSAADHLFERLKYLPDERLEVTEIDKWIRTIQRLLGWKPSD